MNQTKYVVEIYSPGSVDTVLKSFESATPFMALTIGDIVDPRVWEEIELGTVLKIARIVHGLWDVGKSNTHKIMVYTEVIKDPRH